MGQVSIRENTVPTGGAAVTTAAGQALPLLPDTLTLKMLSEKFMASSESNCIAMNPVPLAEGQQTTFTVQNVGLGSSLDLMFTVPIHIVNSVAATLILSPDFPFNIIQNITVQFNGQTVILSASGYELLAMMSKKHKGVFGSLRSTVDFSALTDYGTVPNAIAQIDTVPVVGTGTVVYNPATVGRSLTGVYSITTPTACDVTVYVHFYLTLPFTLRKDLLLGLLPMQNNSVNLNVTITTPTLLGTTYLSPMYIASIPATLTVCKMVGATIQPTYNFWSIPAPNDVSLYSYLISHSYMMLSQPHNALAAGGVDALQYSLPNNYYLMSLLLTLRDSAGVLLTIPDIIGNSYLSYNGTARVDRRDIYTKLARQALQYQGNAVGLGQLIWDATDVDFEANGTNTTKWLNMYLANNPQFIADILGSPSVPLQYSVLREQLVPANIQLV
jgi:hypothetical protein